MKLAILILISSFAAQAQSLTPQEQRALLNEVQDLKRRVSELEKKQGGQGFKSTDYGSKSTASAAPAPQGPAMTEEQRKEIMDTVEKYKKAQAEQEKALKELENDE